MKVFGLNIPNGVSSVHPVELSKEARRRLAWMAWYEAHDSNGRRTCHHFGIGPAPFYLWKGRFDEHGPGALEDGSRRPRRVRTPTWTPQLERAVLDLRRMAPRWGKDKLGVLLRQEGWVVSTSMVGRILTKLRSEGRLSAAPLNDPWRRPIQFRRPYGVRKPKDYLAAAPGHIVQVDTVHVQLFAGFRFKHFTACDVFSRWQVLEAHGRATAHAAAGFLDTILERMPFPVQAIQVDGGSDSWPSSRMLAATGESSCLSSRLARPSSTATSNAPTGRTARSFTRSPNSPPLSPRSTARCENGKTSTTLTDPTKHSAT